jgi:hypothetical protein
MTLRLRMIPFVVGAALLSVAPLRAANVPPVNITGAVKTPAVLSFASLQKMPATPVAIRQHTEKADVVGTFSGPLLWTLIGHAGWKNGPQKNAMLRRTILVTGKDGYAVALGEGEIDPTLEGKKVILAVTRDGKPMASPRLVVPGDSGAPRGVHDVVSVTVQ